MRAAFSGVLVATLLAGLTQSPVALACGASAPPYYVDGEHAPSGVATTLNAPIVVTVHEDPSGPVVDGFNPRLTLTKAGSDVAIELKSLGGLPTLAWVPVEPLEPETTYQAYFNPGYEGIPDTSWPFTTGTESTPTLSLDGKLEVTFEPGTDTIYECPSSPNLGCGSDGIAACTSRVIDVTKARVKIPRAAGGFPGRFGTLWLTDDKPYDFSPLSKTAPEPYHGHNVSVMRGADLDDPSVTAILITVPDEDVAYQPCVAFSAMDARGDEASVEPLCLDAPTLDIIKDGGAGSLGGNTAGPGNAASPTLDPNNSEPGLGNDIKKSGTSTSCSLGRPPARESAWLVLLAPLAVMRRLRRRRGHRQGSLRAARRR